MGPTKPELGLATQKIPDSVLRINRHTEHGIECQHPAVFPVALPMEIIMTYSDRAQIIYDPFCGSGSTIIAAERSNRTCYAMELEPSYCEIAARRFSGG